MEIPNSNLSKTTFFSVSLQIFFNCLSLSLSFKAESDLLSKALFPVGVFSRFLETAYFSKETFVLENKRNIFKLVVSL